MTTRDKLFGFRGRIRRQDWWIYGILIALAQLCLTFAIATVVMTASEPPIAFVEAMDSLPLYVRLPLLLAFLWPALAMAVQRFHDRGASGWPIIVWYGAISGLNFVPASAILWMTAWAPSLDVANTLHIAALVGIGLVDLWFLVMLGLVDGTPGPNRFGPSPKGLGEDPAAGLA